MEKYIGAFRAVDAADNTYMIDEYQKVPSGTAISGAGSGKRISTHDALKIYRTDDGLPVVDLGAGKFKILIRRKWIHVEKA